MLKPRSILSSGWFSWLCVLVAVFSRVVNVLYVSYAGRDKLFLVLQSKSLLDGKGLGVPEYFSSNPDLAVYDYTPMWPPGYPVVLAPFLKLFDYDIYWATSSLDIIACLTLIIAIRKLCFLLGFPLAAVNLMTLVAGCFEYTFINDSKPTDNIPIVLFILAISQMIKNLSSDKLSFWSVLLAAFLLFLPNVFRYSYPPLSVAAPFSVLFVGFLKKDNLMKKKGAWLTVLTTIMIAGFLLTMKSVTGYAGYAVPTARGFFPENIAHWFPIVPGSVMNLSFLTSQAVSTAGLSFETTMKWLEVINVIAVCSLVILFLILFFNKRFLQQITPFKWFLITGFFASAATFVSLGYLSLTYEVQRGLNHVWSYVYDHRYYAFVVIFLQTAFFGWIFLYYHSLINRLIKALIFLCSLVLFIEVTHNIYFHIKVALNFKEYKSSVYREEDYAYFFTLIKELEKRYAGYEIWSAAPTDDFYPYVATYRGHRGIKDAAAFKTNPVKVQTKTILTLMIYDHELDGYRDFLSRSEILFTKRIQQSNNYVIRLMP